MIAEIFDLQRCSFVDGPGIRTTVFFKGCNLNCRWCHNPEGIEKGKTLSVSKSLCTNCGLCKKICNRDKCIYCGKCVEMCPNHARKIIGKYMNEDDILKIVMEDKPFYQNDGGVTCSGGECMLQHKFLEVFLQKCQENNINTAVDTAGAVPWAYFEQILSLTSLFLYDIKCFSSELHKQFTGVDNTLILDNLRKLSRANAKIYIRIPLIPGFNDNDEEMCSIAKFIKSINIEKVEVLPYHSMGVGKAESLGKIPVRFKIPDQKTVNRYQDFFKR